MATKTKEPKASGKKKEEFYNPYNLPKGRLTDFWKKYPNGIIEVIDRSIFAQ